MAHAHDDAIFRFRRDLKTRREGFPIGIQRMIAAHSERGWQSSKDASTLVSYERALAVHRVLQNVERPAEGFHNPLQPQTDAEGWNSAARQFPHQRRNAKILRPGRSR